MGRLRRPFTINTSGMQTPMPGIRLNALDDITMRIIGTSGNNLDVVAGLDIYLIKD